MNKILALSTAVFIATGAFGGAAFAKHSSPQQSILVTSTENSGDVDGIQSAFDVIEAMRGVKNDGVSCTTNAQTRAECAKESASLFND